jgi:hypothetical protein
LSLLSWREVRVYREALRESGLEGEVRGLVEELVGNLREYWERVARVLGRLEGIATYHAQSPELERVREIAGDVVEAYLHELVALREEYSVASHNFMHEVMYSGGKGLYFLAQVFGISTRDLERVAYPKKQLERTRELARALAEAENALYLSARYITNVVGLVKRIDRLLGQAGLEPVWDEARVDSLSYEVERKEFELLDVVTDLRELIDTALAGAEREPG